MILRLHITASFDLKVFYGGYRNTHNLYLKVTKGFCHGLSKGCTGDCEGR